MPVNPNSQHPHPYLLYIHKARHRLGYKLSDLKLYTALGKQVVHGKGAVMGAGWQSLITSCLEAKT